MDRRSFLQTSAATLGASLAVTRASGQSEATFEPTGSVDVPGAAEAVVHPDAPVAYLAVTDGMAAVDFSGGTPEIVAEDRGVETDSGEIGGVWDCWTWADRLIVAGPAQGGSAGRGFALYDTAEPRNPERLAVYETDFAIHNCSFDDGIVYLTGSSLPSQPLVMVDVSDDDPTERNRFSLVDHDPAWAEVSAGLRSLHDVHVHDGVAYLAHWDAGSWLVDVSDPDSPEVLSNVGPYSRSELVEMPNEEAFLERLIPPGNSHVTTVDDEGTVMAVGAEAWSVRNDGAVEGGPGNVILYDVSDKTSPQEVATIDAPESADQTREGAFTTAHNFDIRDGRLYTSWYFGGVKIHDIDDPANPEEIAWWRQPSEAVFWTAQATEEFVVASSVDIQSKIGGSAATRDALYVFPNAAGRQPNPPSLTGESSDDDSDPSGGDDGKTDGDDGNSSSGSDDSGPGFGVAAAAAGLAGTGYALARRRED